VRLALGDLISSAAACMPSRQSHSIAA